MQRVISIGFSAAILGACGSVTEVDPDGGPAPGTDANADLDAGSETGQLIVAPQAPTVDEGDAVFLTATYIDTDGESEDVTSEATWATQNVGTAYPRSAGDTVRVYGAVPGEASVTATYGEHQAEASITVDTALIDVQVPPQEHTLATGTRTLLEAVGVRVDHSVRSARSEISWSSEDSAVATVTSDAEVHAQGEGITNIVASYQGSVIGEAEISVFDEAATGLDLGVATDVLLVEGLGFVQSIASFPSGFEQSLRTEVDYEIVEQSPANPGDTDVIEFATPIFLRGLAEGTATIQASFDGATSEAVEIEVLPADLVPSSIDFSHQAAQSIHGFPTGFGISGDFGAHGSLDVRHLVEFEVSDPQALQVAASRFVPIAPSDGAVEIEAIFPVQDGDPVVGTAEIEVVDEPLSPLEVSVNPSELFLSATAHFGPTAISQDVTGRVRWASTNEDCATFTSLISATIDLTPSECEDDDEITARYRDQQGAIPIQVILDNLDDGDNGNGNGDNGNGNGDNGND